MLRSRLTYANVVASLALFVALGGTSVAATTLISGSKIKQNSIPANRIKKGSLTVTQVNVAKLGTVPAAARADSATTAANAAHANVADTAGHAGTADRATSAANADTVGGAAASAFMPAGRVVTGSADTSETTPQTLLESPTGFRLETDGVVGHDQTVVVRNLRETNIGVVGSNSVSALAPGATRTVTAGGGSPLAVAGTAEAKFIVQYAAAPGTESLVECFFPQAGSGQVQALCRSTQTSS